jgi:hypothetical protein
MDTWDEGGTYDDYMGKWSRPVAGEFLTWLRVPPASRSLDVGCGTGALAGSSRVAGILEADQGRSLV